MILLVVFVAVSGLAIDVNGQTVPRCDLATKCPPPQKLYEELGCTAVEEPGQCCPTKYICPDVSGLTKEKCHYKDRQYAIDEVLSGTEALCAAGCKCKKYGDRALFVCANIECPDLFVTPPTGTVLQYEKDKCCYTNSISEPEEIKKLAKCYYQGREYHQGEKMYPNNDCYVCICQPEFNNHTDVEFNKFCEPIDCGFQLRYLDRMAEGCSPVYYKKVTCCPIDWRCPNEKDKKDETRADLSRKENDPYCLFGTMKLYVGETLNKDDDDVSCTCAVPPFVQCVRSPSH